MVLDDERERNVPGSSTPSDDAPLRRTVPGACWAPVEWEEQETTPAGWAPIQATEATPILPETTALVGKGEDGAATEPEPVQAQTTAAPSLPPLAATVPATAIEAGLLQQLAASPAVIVSTPVLAAPAAPRPEPTKTDAVAEMVSRLAEHAATQALDTLETPEPLQAAQPANRTEESGSRKESTPAFEGVLKSSGPSLDFQTPADPQAEPAAKTADKTESQPVRHAMSEIHTRVRLEPDNAIPVQFSEQPTAVPGVANGRLGERVADLASAPRVSAPADPAGLQSMARVEELLQPSTAAPAPLRSLNIQVEQGGRPVAVVHLEQQTAGMQVAVRGNTPAMAEALRAELPQLVRTLREGGIESDLHARPVATAETATGATSSMRSGMNDRGGESRDGHQAAGSYWQQRERRENPQPRREPMTEDDE